SLAPKGEMRAHMLTERTAFATFPRLKMPAAYQGQRLLVASFLVVKRAKLHTQIVPLLHQLRMLPQFQEARCGRNAHPFPKLVSLKKQACVFRIRQDGFVVSRTRSCRFAMNVEIPDAQVAPRNGKLRSQLGCPFPHSN